MVQYGSCWTGFRYLYGFIKCEKINPSNCDIATKIRISNQIDAFDDAFPPAPSTTVATTVGSVLANNGNGADSLNGIAVTSANTDVTPLTTGPLSIDADGNLTLAKYFQLVRIPLCM
jgi:hypothetical protein